MITAVPDFSAFILYPAMCSSPYDLLFPLLILLM
jgi:hypothetical protein